MSKSSVTVTLGGTDYKVPMLNIGQLEELTDVFLGPAQKAGFGVLKIALSRADPAVETEKFSAIAATRKEIKAAVDAIMELSGFEVETDKRPNGKSPENPPGKKSHG
jgi:hypothetical protein